MAAARRAAQFLKLGQGLLKAGDVLAANDVFDTGLRLHPGHRRMRQLKALALAQSGATSAARELLEALGRSGAEPETLGLTARTWKDDAANATSARVRRDALGRALALYARAFRLAESRRHVDDAVYAGINTAALQLLLGQRVRARATAGRVSRWCERRLARGWDYWAAASLGEAALIDGELEVARHWYQQASAKAGRAYRDVSSTRRQARLLLHALGEAPDALDGCFVSPTVLVFSGHRLDAPGRRVPRFPPALEPLVRAALARELARYPAKLGFSGAASGADLLFLEEMRRQGAEYEVILPYPGSEAVDAQECGTSPARWLRRFRRARDGASRVLYASGQSPTGSSIAFEYANQLASGLAQLRAQHLDARFQPLVVWDRLPGDGAGGTAWQVSRWRAQGVEPRIIDLAALRDGGSVAAAARAPRPGRRARRSTRDQRLHALLFADVVQFTKIPDPVIPAFVQRFMGGLARLMHRRGITPVHVNTWGDALYLAIESLEAAGCFALEIVDWVGRRRDDWQRQGLPHEIDFRIGLHAGPAFRFLDPFTGARMCTGRHVSHAARIEPITPPGHVYASESFAAIAADRGIRSFRCDYVGRVPFAKSYGEHRVYLLRRAEARGRRGPGVP